MKSSCLEQALELTRDYIRVMEVIAGIKDWHGQIELKFGSYSCMIDCSHPLIRTNVACALNLELDQILAEAEEIGLELL